MLPVSVLPADPDALAATPLTSLAYARIAAEPPADFSPSGYDRNLYLDLAEVIVRQAAAWVDETGAVIDPGLEREFLQTSPRFVGAAGPLLAMGRCTDLSQTVYRVMDHACATLAGKQELRDFWMRELCTAYACLSHVAPEAKLAAWSAHLRAFDTNANHSAHGQGNPNFAAYASAGEMLRERLGLLPPGPGTSPAGSAFATAHMPAQLDLLTDDGLYRDPGDPLTYDMTTRLQLLLALAAGYTGPAASELNTRLARGGLVGLLYMTPGGHFPFGGRSHGYQFNEAMTAAVCEIEAARWAGSEPAVAGAFKRQARLSALATRRWIAAEPMRHIKNAFDPKSRFGEDGYGSVAKYGCLAASFFALAALLADDTILESPCPAEVGGYAFELSPAFHKVFMNVAGTSVQIDTAADLAYDATGVGRFCRRGVPLELGPGMPFTASPKYELPAGLISPAAAAVGVEWRTEAGWARLAGATVQRADVTIANDNSSAAEADSAEADVPEQTVTIRYTLVDAPTVTETYRLAAGRLRVSSRVEGGMPVRMTAPLLETDGQAAGELRALEGRVHVDYRGAELMVAFDDEARYGFGTELIANRHGVYRLLLVEGDAGEVSVELTLG